MPVDIVGSATFAGQVISALRVICPCRPLSLDAGQRVALGFGGGCACGFGAGTRLVSTLVEGSEGLRIAGPCCNSTYSPVDRKLYFCPDQRLPSCFDEPAAPPAITLAHELIHALVDLYRPDLPNTEVAASRAENQIRREHGIAPRCCYGADEVEVEGGFLDASWTPIDPDCGAGEGTDLEADVRKALWTVRWTAEVGLARVFGCATCSSSASRTSGSGATPIDRLAERARAYRDGHELAPAIDRVVASFVGRSGRLYHLERVVVDGGLRVLVIHVEGTEATVVTNVGVDPNGPRLVPLGGLLRYRFTLDDVGLPAPPSFPEGTGGEARVHDGSTTWLEVRDGSVATRGTAVYGLHQPIDPCLSDPPSNPDDRARWQAINEVWELWVQLSALTPDEVTPV